MTDEETVAVFCNCVKMLQSPNGRNMEFGNLRVDRVDRRPVAVTDTAGGGGAHVFSQVKSTYVDNTSRRRRRRRAVCNLTESSRQREVSQRIPPPPHCSAAAAAAALYA